jgi:hypothetical protein
MIPKIIAGGSHSDDRGLLQFNNSFDVTAIKRIYLKKIRKPHLFVVGKDIA